MRRTSAVAAAAGARSVAAPALRSVAEAPPSARSASHAGPSTGHVRRITGTLLPKAKHTQSPAIGCLGSAVWRYARTLPGTRARAQGRSCMLAAEELARGQSARAPEGVRRGIAAAAPILFILFVVNLLNF